MISRIGVYGIAGIPAAQYFGWPAGTVLPSFITNALSAAIATGYSVPFNNVTGSLNVYVANPDQTINVVDQYGNLMGGPDNSFRPGPNLIPQVTAIVQSVYPLFQANQGAIQQQIANAQANANAPVAHQQSTSVQQGGTGANVQFITTPNPAIGDTWTVQITGATPNATVSASATKNGQSLGTTNFGHTDSSGSFSLSGTFDSTTVGTWQETWMVSGQAVGNIYFTISSLAGMSNAQHTGNPSPTGGQQQSVPPSTQSGWGGDFMTGLEADFQPSQWGTVLGSGNLTEIAGLLAIPALFLVIELLGKRRR